MYKGRVFVGGIMQGSKREMAVHDQTYRDQIGAIVRRRHPDIEIVDPAKLHPDSGGSTFLATQINRAKDILLGKVGSRRR